MAFYTTKQDIQKAKDLLLRQPDMFVSLVVYEGKGIAAVSGDDVTITPTVSPGWVSAAYVSTVGINFVIKDDNGGVVEGLVKSNTASEVVFDATLARQVNNIDDTPETPKASAGSDFTAGVEYDFQVMSPQTEYEYGDYFGIVKEPAFGNEEEMAQLEDPVEGLIAEGLIKVNMSITGVNYNVVNGDVLKAVRNMVEVGSQTTYTQLHGGFRPAVRSKYRVTFFGKTDDDKDFEMRYFLGKFRAEGELAPNGTEYTSLGWGFTPYADPLILQDRTAYKITVQK